MKTLFFILLMFTGCATTQQDKLTEDLASHVMKCACMIKEGLKVDPYKLNWNDKSKLKEQIDNCRCTIEFKMDEVEQPLDYIRPNTSFVQTVGGYPWDPDYKHLKELDK